MTIESNELPSCPHCWDNKCACSRDLGSNGCQKCIRLLKHTDLITVEEMTRFHSIRAESYGNAAGTSEINTFTSVDIKMGFQRCDSRGQPLRNHDCQYHTYLNDGPFGLQNPLFIDRLDKMVRKLFSAQVRGANKASAGIAQVILLGGYALLLCATTQWRARWSGLWSYSAGQQRHLNEDLLIAQFYRLVLSRFYGLLSVVLENIIIQDMTRDIYAAAALMKYELGFYKKALRCDFLAGSGHLPEGLEAELITCFASVEKYLTHHLRLGCGLYPDWQDAIATPLHEIRRKARTIKVDLEFHQHRLPLADMPGTLQSLESKDPLHTLLDISSDPDYSQPYTAIGDGNITLSLPALPPMLPVPKFMYYDVLLPTEELHSYVSLPLSSSTDEDIEEDTSDLSRRILFPNLGQTKRFS